MRNLTFNYSLDGGSTFKTAITVKCLSVRCVAMPYDPGNPNNGSSLMGTNATECQSDDARLRVTIVVAPYDIDPLTNAATANSNFIFLQKWAIAPTRRIYNADVATRVGIDGWTDFDSASNTAYLNREGDPQYEFFDNEQVNAGTGATTRSMRKATFTMYTKNKISLA